MCLYIALHEGIQNLCKFVYICDELFCVQADLRHCCPVRYRVQMDDPDCQLKHILCPLDVVGLWPHMAALRVVFTTECCGSKERKNVLLQYDL